MCIFEPSESPNKKYLKLLFLADLNSAHTIKWALALAGKGHEVGIFTLNKADKPWFEGNRNIQVFDRQVIDRKAIGGSTISKLVYLKANTELRKIIRQFNPDLIHAHYATSYGLLGARSGFHPFVISAWGSDVMDFPSRSLMHRLLIRNILRKADLLLATSNTIADCILRLSDKKAKIVSFGVDTSVFSPGTKSFGYTNKDLVIGTVKALEAIYGIDVLLNAFALLFKKHPALPLKLLVVGGGSKEQEYKLLAGKLGISGQTFFTGKVAFADVPAYHNSLDIFANLSNNESFGVSVLEAEACGKPVVVTDIGGLKEVMVREHTGIAIPPGDVQAAAYAFETLVLSETLRLKMGGEGRRFVVENFEWSASIHKMEQLYKALI
jgi:glycosyltransferase involved in cell wall biosynthesis